MGGLGACSAWLAMGLENYNIEIKYFRDCCHMSLSLSKGDGSSGPVVLVLLGHRAGSAWRFAGRRARAIYRALVSCLDV